MHLIAHSKEEAIEIAQRANLHLAGSGNDSGFPVYIVPWGTHSQLPLDEFLCFSQDEVETIWDRWITGQTHEHFKRVHVIRYLQIILKK